MKLMKKTMAVVAALVLGGLCWWGVSSSSAKTEQKASALVQAETVAAKDKTTPKSTVQKLKISRAELLKKLKEKKAVHSLSNASEKTIFDGKTRQEQKPLPASGKDAADVTDTPRCSRYPNAPVLAYRTSVLPPKTKGGSNGELREWLLKLSRRKWNLHVDEEWFPNEAGEMVCTGGEEYVANRVMVTVSADCSDSEFAKLIEPFGARMSVLSKATHGRRFMTVMATESTLDTVSELTDTLNSIPYASDVGKDCILSCNKIPNDTKWSGLWGMMRIKAREAWDVRTDASSVLVGVIDSGINYNHEDLAANMWRNPDKGGLADYPNDHEYGACCTELDENNNGIVMGDPMDEGSFHGSHVAGTIGGVGNNGKGVAGVAWKVKLMALKFLQKGEDYEKTGHMTGATSCVVPLLDYALQRGCHIVNGSFGPSLRYATGYNAQVRDKVEELRNAGIIFVCAAGNDCNNNDSLSKYPASYAYDNIVSVAASDVSNSDGLCTDFSNYGATSVDLAAPGREIRSCYGDGYGSYQGTSQAAPHVTGALALLKAHYPNEGYQSLIQRLYSGVDKVAALNGKVKTGGRLNVLKALNGSSLPKPVVASISKGTYSGEVRIKFQLPFTSTPYSRVLRSRSENGEMTPLCSWLKGERGGFENNYFCDPNVDPGTIYYYRVQFATSAAGANASPYSDVVSGWASSTAKYPDQRDPQDNSYGSIVTAYDTWEPTYTWNLPAGKQGLNSETDSCDWHAFSLTSGRRYVFETVRAPDHATDTYGELYEGSTNYLGALVSNTPVATDDNGGTNNNFRIVYTAKRDGLHGLKITLAGESAKSGTHYYFLRHKRLAIDEWDSTDDTPAGATELTPTTTVQTHGQHSLDACDPYDFFKVKMTAGRTYIFETTGSGDTYGEIFDSTLTNNAHCVAFDDDGGTNSNFKIIFTPKVSQTYYLRIRPRTEIPITGKYFNYSLKYNMADTSASAAHDLEYLKPKTWSNPVVLTRVEDDFSCQYSFTPNDRIYLRYAYHDAEGNSIGRHTNMYMALRRTGGTSESFDLDDYEYVEDLEEECDALSAGYFREVLGLSMNPGILSRGEYAVILWLDYGEQISETDEEDNVWLVTFNMVDDTDKKLTGLEIRGPDSLSSGASGKYAAYAKYDDGSLASVEATWSSTSDYATMDGDGTLRVRDLTADVKATLSARYTEDAVTKTATKDVTLYAPRDVGADPFGDIDTRPEHDMSVYAEVTIDGEPAQANDVLAAYVGDELRGRKELNANGRCGILIYADDGEQVEFRVWSRQNGETYTAVRTLIGVDGGDLGDPNNPYRVECASTNPFGVPVVNGTAQMSIQASVAIKGEPAESGDVVGVFCGDELRDVGVVCMDGEIAVVKLSPYVNAGETLTFMVWDASAEDLFNAKGNVSAVAGGSLGTKTNPHLIEVSDEATLSLTLDGSATWQFVSVNVVPEDNSPRSIFGSVLDDITRVTCDGKLFNPSWGDSECDLTAIEPGKGYWVKRKTSGRVTQSITGMPADVSATKIGLKSGWNAVGYVPQQEGNIKTVFANALSQGIVARISDGNGNLFFPSLGDEENSLTVMRPGNAYWVKVSGAGEFTFVEPSGSSAASALAALSASSVDSDEEHPFGSKRDVDGVAGGIYLRAKLDFFGTMASYGEAWVAAYVEGSDIPCDVKSVNMAGTVVMGISKSTEKAPLTLTFKVYDVNSGRTYTAANTITYAIGEDGKEWDRDGAIIKVSGTLPTYQVVFDLNGEPNGSGVRTGGGVLTQAVSRLSAAIAPTVKGNPGFEFQTWDADFSSVKGDMTIHAVYQLVEIEYATVKFNANGGTLAANATNRTIVVGSKLGILPSNPSRSGYTFAGWYTSASGGTSVTANTIVSARVTYYAHWTQNVQYATVTFNANGGTLASNATNRTIVVGSKLGTLPSNPSRSGYTFAGWYTSASGGTSVTANTIVSARVTYYAHWTQNVQYATVTFDANGGRVSPSVITQAVNSVVTNFPTPRYSAHAFKGWYTAVDGGTAVTGNTVVRSNVTWYAHWSADFSNVTKTQLVFTAQSKWGEALVLSGRTDGSDPATQFVIGKYYYPCNVCYSYKEANSCAYSGVTNAVVWLKRYQWTSEEFNFDDFEVISADYVTTSGNANEISSKIYSSRRFEQRGEYAVWVFLGATRKFFSISDITEQMFEHVRYYGASAASSVEWRTFTVVDPTDSKFDAADPKDDTAKGAVNWVLKDKRTSFDRTLGKKDLEDNFKITGKDGLLYDFAIENADWNVVFSITNTNGKAVVDVSGNTITNVWSARRVLLPKTAKPYYLTVKHGGEEKRDGFYTIAGQYADVGSIKFAKTAVSVKESAAYVELTVNRTGKNGRVRVKYATAANTAKPGEDYVPQSGVIEWANGDKKAKKIRVTLIPDLVAIYDGEKSKNFSVKLTPFSEAEQEADEYPAVIAGSDTCVVTINETSKPGTTVESVYAKQAAKRATVKTEVAPLESGTFYGLLVSTNAVNEQSEIGSLTFTASSAAVPTLSAKATIAGKTYSFKGKGWAKVREELSTLFAGIRLQTLENVMKIGRTTCTNTLTVVVAEGNAFTQDDWHKTSSTFAALDLNVMDEYGDIKVVEYYSQDFYRNNAKIQSYLDAAQKFAGYYTVSLQPCGCVGNGYLTLTIDNKGNAKVAGMLPDGVTKPSVSVKSCGIVPDSASANGYAMYVPVFMGKATFCFGGTLRLIAVRDENALNGTGMKIVLDETWKRSAFSNAELIWNSTADSLGYCDGDADGVGFTERLTPCGGWYDKVVNLQAYYLNYAMSIETEDVGNFPTQDLPDGYDFVTAVDPRGFALAFENDKIVHDKKKIVKTNRLTDFDLSVNPCNVSVKFTRATGLVTGGCSVWSENRDGSKQKEITGFKAYGVFLLNRMDDSTLDDGILAPGFITKKYKITGYDDWTGRKTTYSWSFSAPFNIRGEWIDWDWSE